MDDFDSLVAAMKERGLYLLMDYVPNHTSDQHPWFNSSIYSIDPYTDYYVWANGTGVDGMDPPNNWISMFGNSSWEYNSIRQQFYLHQFLIEQPDLNYRNPAVHQELLNNWKFWLDKGVDAFRGDAFPFLYEDELLRNESRSYADGITSTEWAYLNHTYTECLPELIDILTEWREFLNNYTESVGDGEHRFMMTENYCSVANAMTYYGTESFPLADFPINFQFLQINLTDNNAYSVYQIINEWATAVPDWAWPNWLVGNHDNHRVGSESRMTPALVDGMNMMVLLLQGTPTVYYGEELGMVDNPNITYSQGADPQACDYGTSGYYEHTRDMERTPMQWNSSDDTGFTSSDVTPWLPVNADHVTVNVDVESAASRSHLTVFKELVALRNAEYSILSGAMEFPVETNDLLSFSRLAVGHPGYLVLISFTADTFTVNMTAADCCANYTFPSTGYVVVAGVNSTRQVNDTVNLQDITLTNYEALVIEFEGGPVDSNSGSIDSNSGSIRAFFLNSTLIAVLFILTRSLCYFTN